MRFHLNYQPRISDFKLDHTKKIFLIGSCFSENIGNTLNEYKFDVLSNPDGILFNPSSIANSISNIILNNTDFQKFILKREGVYYSFFHHSSVNATQSDKLLEKISIQNQLSHDFLKTADVLVITFGTALVYRHKELNKTIANCHKQTQNIFEKKLLSVEQIVKNYSVLIEHLQLFNPSLKIIFTVSPVKYLKDGVEENSLSKAVLLVSVNELIKKFSNSVYFPSYELINDDLRDYRFYKEDLAHPNEQAIEYVWGKFSSSFFSGETFELNNRIKKIQLALKHRPMNELSEENDKLKNFIESQKAELFLQYPYLRERF